MLCIRKCICFLEFLAVLSVVEECTAYRAYNHRIETPFQYKSQKQKGIKNRFHPSTYSAEDSKEEDQKPVALPDMPVQYAYEGGDSHEGEIIVGNGHQQQSMSHQHVTDESHDHDHDVHHAIQMSHHYDHESDDYASSAPSSFDGYHYNGYPYPPPRPPLPPPPPPPPPPPHKSKQTNDAEFAYYYIGRHLWYVPLYFSIYFVAYVGLLVLKSIARHKVLLPQLSEQAAISAQNARRAAEVQRSISESEQKYYM